MENIDKITKLEGQMMDKETEEHIRRIAREEARDEALKVQEKVLKEMSEIKSTLSRLERLLLGEIGSNEEDTLKARANFAYLYAKRNTEARIIERALPAIAWFEDMNTVEKGCSESNLDIIGKMITGYSARQWINRFLGVVNIATLLGLVFAIITLVKVMRELGVGF